MRAFNSGRGAVLTFKALLSNDLSKVLYMEPICFNNGHKSFLLRDFRDAFPLNSKYMIVRPYFRSIGGGGIFIAPYEGAEVMFNELKPIPELLP